MGDQLRIPTAALPQSQTVVDEYYNLVETKQREYCETDDSTHTFLKDLDLDAAEAGDLALTAAIPSEEGELVDWEALVSLFGDDSRLEDPRKIRRVIQYFRDIEEAQSQEVVCVFESGPIALCEFALDHGYPVCLDW